MQCIRCARRVHLLLSPPVTYKLIPLLKCQVPVSAFLLRDEGIPPVLHVVSKLPVDVNSSLTPIRHVELDMAFLIRNLIAADSIQQVDGFDRAFVDKMTSSGGGGGGTDSPDQLQLIPEGINFREIFRHPHLFELDRVYSNNTHEMIKRYGVEAGVNAIQREINAVFQAYNIKVNSRHLSLVADFMCMERLLQEQIGQFSSDHDGKYDTINGKLLEHLKAVVVLLRAKCCTS